MTKPFPKTITVVPFAAAPLQRPQLAAWIACIASLSGALERSVAGILNDVMRTHSNQALAMYLALSGSQARKSALLAAARLRLAEPDYKLLVRLYKKIGKNARQRNAVIHGAWATHDSYPDALLLSDPNDQVQFEAALIDLSLTPIPPMLDGLAGDALRAKLSQVNVPSYTIYEEDDLRNLAANLTEIILAVEKYRNDMRSKYRWQLPAPESDPTDNLPQQTNPEGQ